MNIGTPIGKTAERQMTEGARRLLEQATEDRVLEQSVLAYKAFVESVNRAKDAEIEEKHLRRFAY